MKIVCLLASPRGKGNSTTIARRFLDKVKISDVEVRTFSLNKLNYRGCQACMTCKNKLDRCVLKDDLSEVLEAVRSTDILVIASPVYWYDISAQLKTFIDRTYSYLVPDYLTNPNPSRLKPGKKLVFILAQGGDETLYADIYPRYKKIFQWLGFTDDILIRACGVREVDDVQSRKDLLTLADKVAEHVLSGSNK